MRRFEAPPFESKFQLNNELDDEPDALAYVPGYPGVGLKCGDVVTCFLEKEYCSVDMERIAPKLWLMSKQDSSSISPLHRQRVKGRNIVVTEDPKLHLVWIYDRIFVKPLPRYLTSFKFWEDCLTTNDAMDAESMARVLRIRKAALGFLRTYRLLIQSEFDFSIAKREDLRLVDASITWEHFYAFISHMATVTDKQVAPRYAYGEVRLTRLNFYAPFLLKKANFQLVDHQYGQYFARFYGPILFVLAIVSIIMNGLQIAVGVEQANPVHNGQTILDVSLWFSVVVISGTLLIGLYLASVFLYKFCSEWRFAIRDHLRLLEEARGC